MADEDRGLINQNGASPSGVCDALGCTTAMGNVLVIINIAFIVVFDPTKGSGSL